MQRLLMVMMVLTCATGLIAQVPVKIELPADLPWNPLFSGTGATLFSIRFCDVDTGYVTGEGGLILKTTNGGASWNQLATGTNMPLMALSFTDADHGCAAGIDPFSAYGGFILKTTDGGATWTTPLASGSRYGLYDICFPVPDTGYAVGMFGTVLRSVNSGASWSLLPTITSNSLSSVFFTSAKTGFASGDMGTILKTTDGGQSWVKLTTGTSNSLMSLCFVNDSTGYAAGVFGTVIKTINAGLSWSLLQHATDNHLWAVSFVNPVTGFAAGNGGTILKTVDAGNSWISSASGTTEDLNSLSFASETTGYACGSAGTILKTTNGGWVGLAETPQSAGKLSIFPNPASEMITIDYECITGDATLTILDLRGKALIKQDVKNRVGMVDVRSLAAGVYLVRMETGRGVVRGVVVKGD